MSNDLRTAPGVLEASAAPVVPEGPRTVRRKVTQQARARLALIVAGFDRDFLLQAFKITASATLAWFLATLLMPDATPIYAPITACFIAVATVRASFQDAWQRVVAVVIGIAVAYFVGSALGLHVWTIALITGLGVLAGRALRLPRGAANQIPISGLLLLAIGTTPGNVGDRILETFIGVAVSVLITLIVAPPNHVSGGSKAVGNLVEKLVAVTTDMASGISGRWNLAEAAGWLQQARANGAVADAAENAVDTGAESLRLRPISAQHQVDQLRIEAAMETLVVVEVQIRVIGRTLRDTAGALTGPDGTLPPIRMGADLLAATAEAIAAFGSAALESEQQERDSARSQAFDLIDIAAATAAGIKRDIAEMTAANLTRALHLSALVVETGRVLDELRGGLDRSVLSGERSAPGTSA